MTILATTLVPALPMLRDAMEQSQRIESLHLVTTLCVSKLEQYLNLNAENWVKGNTTYNGNFSADGHADVLFTVVCSDKEDDGGKNKCLMVIACTVWQDVNANGALDSGEPSVTLATKLAFMARYPNAVAP